MALRYLYDQHEIVAKFVSTLIPHCRRGFGDAVRGIGVIDEAGRLIGGLVYYNWDPEAEIIELAGAATHARWLTRGTIARMYQYPFLQCGCQMVVQRTPADDKKLLGQLAAYDYTFVTVPRLFGRDRDGVICSLTYEAWVDNRFNKRFKHHVIDADYQEQEAA